ncbi:hypothetical protein FQN52_005015 [Onygenales sp. PD_12]|nr:hypothetical protein FQN52_005015 [Onygenales sp. PD_12]
MSKSEEFSDKQRVDVFQGLESNMQGQDDAAQACGLGDRRVFVGFVDRGSFPVNFWQKSAGEEPLGDGGNPKAANLH